MFLKIILSSLQCHTLPRRGTATTTSKTAETSKGNINGASYSTALVKQHPNTTSAKVVDKVKVKSTSKVIIGTNNNGCAGGRARSVESPGGRSWDNREGSSLAASEERHYEDIEEMREVLLEQAYFFNTQPGHHTLTV